MLHQDLIRVSWQCVHFAYVPNVVSLQRKLLEHGVQAPEIVGSALRTDEELLKAVAVALRFPDYFGMNWDALDECLRDLEWLPGSGCVLFVLSAERLWHENSIGAGRLVMAWLSAAELWSEQGVPFRLAFVW